MFNPLIMTVVYLLACADYLAVPVKSVRGYIQIYLLESAYLAGALMDGKAQPLFHHNPLEGFYRWKGITTPSIIARHCGNVSPMIFETAFRSVEDFPRHHGQKARGFELVVADMLHAIHTGDNISACDVVTEINCCFVPVPETGYKTRIECKTRNGICAKTEDYTFCVAWKDEDGNLRVEKFACENWAAGVERYFYLNDETSAAPRAYLEKA